MEKRQLRHHLGQWMSLDTLIATREFASILSACIIWPEMGPKRKEWREKAENQRALFIGDFALPVLTHSQALSELPAAPCVFRARLKGSMINAEPCLCARRAAVRTEIKQFLTSNTSTEVFSECGADGSRASVLVQSQQHRDPPGSAGAGSQLSAGTDHPINLNLISLYPTYTMRLICSHLNANVVNVTLRHVLHPFVACGEEWALLRSDSSHPKEFVSRE